MLDIVKDNSGGCNRDINNGSDSDGEAVTVTELLKVRVRRKDSRGPLYQFCVEEGRGQGRGVVEFIV